ncbi:MAG: secretin N-terminal domain-containing protein [Chthoniobacterales bacterium]
MHPRLFLITFLALCSFSVALSEESTLVARTTITVPESSATPVVKATPLLTTNVPLSLTTPATPLPTPSASATPTPTVTHEGLSLPNSPLEITESSKDLKPSASARPHQLEASTLPLKKETSPLPATALSALRAARAKFQAMKQAPETLQQPAASPQPNLSAEQAASTASPTVTPTVTPTAAPTVTPAVTPAVVPISDSSSTNLVSPATTTSPTASPTPINLNEKISMQFPHTSIMEILALYEKLTGKRIIRDSNLAGPELSVMIADPISKKEAINVMESSMLLNGYVLIPVDEKTVKVLGPSRPPRTEGLPLYLEESELPTDGDQLVSFYQPLHFLSTTEAITILQGVVQLNPFGSLVAVPNTSAIVITDKTPIIRKALALLKVIDHESSQIITEFVLLQRADAEKTVETLNQIFGKESSTPAPTPAKGGSGQPGGPNTPNNQPQQPIPPASDNSNPGDERVFSGKVQFIADKRTNRILVVTRAENYRYVRELIANLDKAQAPEEPLVRPLNYMSATDVFPVLVDMLKNKDDDTTQNQIKPQATPQNPFNNSGSSSTSSGLLGSQNPMDGSSSSIGGSSGVNAGGNHADRLNESQRQSPPQSAIVGSTSIVADPTANSIIVYGPPESKAKARQIIDLLDRRPQQVYLAAVIGQMRLEEGMEYGASYLFHYDGFNTLANTFGGDLGKAAGAALLNGINSTFPGAAGTNSLGSSSLTRTAGINNAVSNSQGGLTLFGSIGGSVDMYAKFLESTGKFKTIARPTVYTSNNKKATILSGRRIPYQSQTLNSLVNAGATGTSSQTANSITANITYQDVLLKLEVIPLINSDKEVNLIIAQQNQTVDTQATLDEAKTGINAPVINTQELTTSVRIPSGSTIVLGGLIQDEKNNEEKGIPYVNKIPIIGPLLGGHTQKNKVRTELVVMIQPIVIDSNTSMEKASNIEGGSSDLGTEAKGLEKKLQPTPTPPPKKKKFKLFGMPKQGNY